MSNLYYDKLRSFAAEIKDDVERIFAVYNNELLLRLEEYNLLSNPDNAVESSTAMGYIIEEFLVAKLISYTRSLSQCRYKIFKDSDRSTADSAYDCCSQLDNIRALINIKVCKNGGQNNAVAALSKLYDDYVKKEGEKCYLVLKVHYDYGVSKLTVQPERKIFIQSVETYFLEEVDFSRGHRQDNRNWSKKFNPNSGRLQIPDSFREANKVSVNEISYINTRGQIEQMVLKNAG